MAAQLPPLHRVSDDDHGAHVIVSAYSWASIVAVAAAARLLLALNRKLPWGLDDLSFAIAVVRQRGSHILSDTAADTAVQLLAIASSVLYHLAVNAGLGRHASALDDGGITNYFKVRRSSIHLDPLLISLPKRMYAAHLFGVAAIGCGKLSSVHTSARAIVFEPRIYHVMLGIAAAWTVFSLFVTAFQCNPPSSWEFTPSNCPTKGYLQYAVSVLNIITDIIIAASVIPTVWKLRMPKDQRITVLVLFTLRFVYVYSPYGTLPGVLIGNRIPCVVIGQIVILANTLRSSDQPCK